MSPSLSTCPQTVGPHGTPGTLPVAAIDPDATDIRAIAAEVATLARTIAEGQGANMSSCALRLAHQASELAAQTMTLAAELQRTQAALNQQQAALEQARREATHDPLAGLANRRALDTALAERILAGRPFVLLLVDIDHFKRINDTYGHPTGDHVLRELARLLARRVRDSDTVARFGGEEFAMLLPDTTLSKGERIAEKVRTAVERHALRRNTDPERTIHITASVGVAEYQPGERTSDLLDRADVALYRAKHNGRNRVEMATGQLELEID